MTYKTDLGYSPLTKKIYIGQLKDDRGMKTAHPSKPKIDVTNKAAQFAWMLVKNEGGVIEWRHPDGGVMRLEATLTEPKDADL